MVGLLDIAPSTEDVTINGGQSLEVKGIPLSVFVNLVRRFPHLYQAMAGKSLDIDSILSLGEDVVNALIAAATGHAGNIDVEAKAALLPLGTQVDIIGAALRTTLPQGVDPFLQSLENLAAVLDGGIGKRQDTISQQASNILSKQGTPQK